MPKSILLKNKLNKLKVDLPDTFKFFPIKYNQPKNNDLIIVLAYFNFSKSTRILQNLLMVKDSLEKSNIPYILAEITHENDCFYFNKQENIYQFKTDSYMFYKENLINLLESKISEKYTKICFLDADIMFDDLEWYDKISEKLNEFDIIQPFENCIYLDFEFKKQNSSKSICFCYENKIIKSQGHAGYAWAFKRNVFNKIKMPDFCICGNGDNIFVNALFEDLNQMSIYQRSYMNSVYEKYKRNFDIKLNISYLNLNVYHLFHSSITNRKYQDRDPIVLNILKSVNLKEINEVIEYNEEGLLKWKDNYKDLFNAHIFNYFKNRNDDSL